MKGYDDPEGGEPLEDETYVPLEKIIDKHHPLVLLSQQLDWDAMLLSARAKGQIPASTTHETARLMIALLFLQQRYELDSEELLARLKTNPYWQYFCGLKLFRRGLRVEHISYPNWQRQISHEPEAQIPPRDPRQTELSGHARSDD